MQKVIEGKFDSRGKVSYGGLKKIEVDAKEGMSLIEDARKERVLRQDIEKGIERILSQVE